jgi:hypothetical protein
VGEGGEAVYRILVEAFVIEQIYLQLKVSSSPGWMSRRAKTSKARV